MEQNKILPRFDPQPSDEYVKPERHSLISYLWHNDAKTGERMYRTGVVCTVKGGTVRFFEGFKTDGAPCAYEQIFHLSEKYFKSMHFRVRTDLQVGRTCYDWLAQRWCTITKIDVRTGGVYVMYFDEKGEQQEDRLISPDPLVGGSMDVVSRIDNSSVCKESPLEDTRITPHNSAVTPNRLGRKRKRQNFRTLPTRKRKKENKEPQGQNVPESENDSTGDEDYIFGDGVKSYCGVYTSPATDIKGRKWYIRGRLAKIGKGSRPVLLKGESVTFIPGGKVAVEYLEYSYQQQKYLQVISSNDKNECIRNGQRGEKSYATWVESNRCVNGSQRATSLRFRPLQPVFVLGVGNATLSEEPDKFGFAKVWDRSGRTTTVSSGKLRLIGYKRAPVDLVSFFRRNASGLPKKKDYSKPGDFLLRAWKMANSEAALRFEKEFDAKIAERAQIRTLANGNGDGISLTVTGKSNLLKRCATLLGRLQEDFESNQAHTQQQTHDLKRQIIDIKNRLPNPNLLLLCGGFAPEVTAYKRLNAAPLGKVIIQEVDLHAVGVAVAAHPEVEFCIVIDRPSSRCPRKPGDVRILTNLQVVREVEVLIGGIHHISITNPCQSFSLAGKKDGFNTESGRLLWDCCTAVRNVSASSEMPSYLAENVPSTIEVNETSDWYLPEPDARYFPACASMCSPCIRKRKFAMNRPPVVCSTGPNSEPGKPPSLDGNQQSLCAAAIVKTNRMVHPDMMKLPCQLNSNPMRNECIWEQTDECLDPVRSSPTPDEAERAMGYRENEVGITQKSVERAVQKRIEEHDFEQNGCLVSLKGCASDPDYPAEDVPPLRRLQLLGNSECVTLLEAFMWSDQQLFPPVS